MQKSEPPHYAVASCRLFKMHDSCETRNRKYIKKIVKKHSEENLPVVSQLEKVSCHRDPLAFVISILPSESPGVANIQSAFLWYS